MPYRLDFPVPAEIEHTVKSGIHRQASGIVMGGAESAELAAFTFFHTVCLRVVIPFRLVEKPVHSVCNARSHIDILEQGKIRKAYLEIMRHTVLELVPETGLVEFGGLEIYLVLKSRAVSERELFIELFLADPVFPFERIEPAHGKCKVRQCEGIGAVSRVLAVQSIDRQVHFAVPVFRIGYRRRNLVLQGLGHGSGVVLVVGRAGEIDRCAE